jgi:hypothetical protein
MLQNKRDPDPKKLFIKDLAILVTNAQKEDKDIILTGDFNELVGDDPRGMSKVLIELLARHLPKAGTHSVAHRMARA